MAEVRAPPFSVDHRSRALTSCGPLPRPSASAYCLGTSGSFGAAAARPVLAIADDNGGTLFRPMTPDATHLIRRHLDRKAPWRLVKEYRQAAGIDPDRLGGRGIGIHSLRKTAINDAIRNGASMHEVREFAGHADIRTTEVYFVRREEDAEVAARRIQIRLTGSRGRSARRRKS